MPTGAAEALLARLEQSEPVVRVRQEIFRALGRLGAEASLAAIEACLAEESEIAVRVECARAPGNIDSPRAEKLALRAVSDDNPQVRLQAIASLGSFTGPETVQVLKRLSSHTDVSTRQTALLALGRGRSGEAGEVLLAALEQADTAQQKIIVLQALTLLAEPELAEAMGVADPLAIHAARRDLRPGA